MTSYLVESYLADSPAAAEEARESARSLTDDDTRVRYVRTTFVPGDETVLHLFEAPSVPVLREAALRAALRYERIVEAIESTAPSMNRDADAPRATNLTNGKPGAIEEGDVR
jgi:hypothetical protein